MITKPAYARGSSQSAPDEEMTAVGHLSVDCGTSLYIYDGVEHHPQTAGDYGDTSELLFQQHGVHPGQQQQQQQVRGCDVADDAVLKLQLLAGCGTGAATTQLDYPWMRDKKTTTDGAMACLSTSGSERPLNQCITSDAPLIQTAGLPAISFVGTTREILYFRRDRIASLESKPPSNDDRDQTNYTC